MSNPELHVRTEVPALSWEEFVDTHPVGSIALDGYVAGEPHFEPKGPYLNVNHHEGVDRLATLTSAQQVLMKTRMGLDKAFMRYGVFAPKIFVNDCDQDVCAAWFLLNNIELTKSPTPALNRFISIAGTLDATAGAFPYDRDLDIFGELAWVFEPYAEFRASGEMANNDNEQFRAIINEVEDRIALHITGRGKSAEIDTAYTIIGGSKDWKMIEETGKDGRVGALVDGIDAYVTAQELPDQRWRYTVGRRSEYIPFDVQAILEALNEAEGCDEDRWGGAAIIGGSPRVNGSELIPQEVEAIVNECVKVGNP